MKNRALQHAIFLAIEQQLPKERSMVDELKPILKRTKNAVYKRMNGSVPLTLEDICLLAEHFHLPLDKNLCNSPTAFQADFSGFGAQTSSLQYLDILDRELSALQQEKDVKVWYVSSGLPDFYFFYFEELTLFKSFIWERMVWGAEEWQWRRFKLDIPERHTIVGKAKKLAGYYSFIETVEIWNDQLLDSLFQQVVYVAESRLYENKEDVLLVLESIGKMIGHLEEMAFREKHFEPLGQQKVEAVSFQLFYNETMQNNIFLLMENANRREVYTVLNTPNFIKTADSKMADYMHIQVQRLLKRSVPLGQSGEKYRRIYFDKLYLGLERCRDRVVARLDRFSGS